MSEAGPFQNLQLLPKQTQTLLQAPSVWLIHKEISNLLMNTLRCPVHHHLIKLTLLLTVPNDEKLKLKAQILNTVDIRLQETYLTVLANEIDN